MSELKNSDVLGDILRALYTVAARRTTQSFAAAVIGSIIKTLEQNHDFLKYVRIEESGYSGSGDVVDIAPDIDSVDPVRVGRAIEAIIRVVYMDLIGKAGLFFMNELKKYAGEGVISEIKNYGVDLAALQTEQHYLYRRREKKKPHPKGRKHSGDVSLLGYTWNNVSSWKYDPSRKVCTLYDKGGKVLDQLNLDTIIENYVKELSESYDELPSEYEEGEEIAINEKELELLKMLHSRDIDAETAVTLLHISKNEFESMVRKLLQIEMLHYVSFNVVELTEIGISYLSKKENIKNNKFLEKRLE